MKALASGRCIALLSIAATLVLLAGCGGGGSAAPAQPSSPSSASFHFSTSSLDFGSVNVGTTKTLSISMSNTGTAGVTVTQLSVNSAQFSVSGVSLPLTLNPGQTTSGSIVFTPSASGAISGVLNAMTSSGSVGSISLVGTGMQLISTHTVNLSWVASSSTNVVAYNIYRSNASAGPYTKIGNVAGTSYMDSTVQTGQTYFYTVTAVDNANVESAVTGPVTAVIPAT